MQYHKYSLSELENMMPWERKIYIALVAKHVKEENERMEMQKQQLAASQRARSRRRR